MPPIDPKDEIYRMALQQAKASAARRLSDQVKALEQLQRMAEQARVSPKELEPESTWPFKLTKEDVEFLRSLPYPISPA